jgi:hypothetical protein
LRSEHQRTIEEAQLTYEAAVENFITAWKSKDDKAIESAAQEVTKSWDAYKRIADRREMLANGSPAPHWLEVP